MRRRRQWNRFEHLGLGHGGSLGVFFLRGGGGSNCFYRHGLSRRRMGWWDGRTGTGTDGGTGVCKEGRGKVYFDVMICRFGSGWFILFSSVYFIRRLLRVIQVYHGHGYGQRLHSFIHSFIHGIIVSLPSTYAAAESTWAILSFFRSTFNSLQAVFFVHSFARSVVLVCCGRV